MTSKIWLPIVAAIGVSTAAAGCGGATRAKAPSAPVPPPAAARPTPPPAPPAQPVDPVTTLIGTSQKHFEAGQRELTLGHLDRARTEFDQAVDVLLESPYGARTDARMREHFDRLIDRISAYELTSLAKGDGAHRANQALERAVSELRDGHAVELRKHHGQTLRLRLAAGSEVLARPFASIYVLSLFFENPVSEPIALGAILHAAHSIERLVLALPPIDPDPGAKVIKLFR